MAQDCDHQYDIWTNIVSWGTWQHWIESEATTGKSCSTFQCEWLKEVFYCPVRKSFKYCFLKAMCTPSIRVNDIPHELRVKIEKKSGKNFSTYCSCVTGSSYKTVFKRNGKEYFSLAMYCFLVIIYFLFGRGCSFINDTILFFYFYLKKLWMIWQVISVPVSISH